MRVKPLMLGILGSGKGSNGRAILEAIRRGELDAEVRLIASDNADAGILGVAKEFGIPALVIPAGEWRTRLATEVEEQLVGQLRDAGVELVALAGFMRILKAPLLRAFPRRVINIHPSLLPQFPGQRAWAQALSSGEKVTGCTVHFVDAGIDTGEIIAQTEVEILPNDTPESLHARIQSAEYALYPAVIGRLAAARATQACSDF